MQGVAQEIPARASYAAMRQLHEKNLMKSSVRWRTIILSSLGRTIFPYSHYIRTFDLGKLQQLLSDFEFGPFGGLFGLSE